MCGIVGVTGNLLAKPILLDGLKRLEYRGYDSAGFALSSRQGGRSEITVKRSAGPVQGLIDLTLNSGETETCGIAHTRWATHGVPSEANAHPHRAGDLVLVHNGIIENFASIRQMLIHEGIEFHSQTDTEVFAQLIEYYRLKINRENSTRSIQENVLSAIAAAMAQVHGHYAILLMVNGVDGVLFGVQHGAPLVASLLENGSLIASDLQAILPYHDQVCFLPQNEIFVATETELYSLDPAQVRLQNFEKRPLKQEKLERSVERVEKGGHDSFMMKEIFEQPVVVAETLNKRIPLDGVGDFTWEQSELHKKIWQNAKRIYLIACGTSYHAALVAKYYFERWSKLDCQVDIASEFRYRDPVFEIGTVVGVISQSGETADTLAALRMANQAGVLTFSICNVANSTICREASLSYLTRAGAEIGVASTKAFTAQLTLLCGLALDVARARGYRETESVQALKRLPFDLTRVLSQSDAFVEIGASLKDQRMVLLVGRGTMYPIALEGALKLKELSYIPSEGFAAGELKHGPIAYVDSKVTIIALAPRDELYAKTISNIEEIRARGGRIIAIGTEDDQELKNIAHDYIGLPKTAWGTLPILTVVPLQLIAYGCTMALGKNIDKPRNLAKSVTVE